MRSSAVHDAELAIGNRVAVGVVRRESELGVDLRLELLGERVLEELRLGVHLVERQPEPIDEVALEQTMVAKHLERATPPGIGERDSTIRHSLDEAELVEALGHRGRRRRAHAHPLRERRRRHALARGLEGVDRLQVVLDGDAEIGRLGWHFQRLRLHSDSELVMTKTRLTRGKLLAAAAPLAAVPLVGKLALDASCRAVRTRPRGSQPRADAREPPRGLDGSCRDGRRRGSRGRRANGSRRASLPTARVALRAGARPRVHADRDRHGARGRARRLLPGVGVQRHRARPGDPRDRGRPAARQLRQRRLAPAHDPLPRDPPDEHGRRLRDRRARRVASRTSSRRARRACSCTTATRRR